MTVVLKAKKREVGTPKEVTEVFGNIYGKGKENRHIIFKYSDFEKVYHQVGMSEILVVDVEGDKHEVIIKDIQVDPRKDRFYHVDFYEFNRGEEMEAEVPLKFIGEGETEAEKNGGILNIALDTLEISVLPKDLPKEIEVDLSGLKEIGDVIRVEDLKLPSGVKVLNDKDVVVISVVEPEEDNNNLESEEEEKEE